MLSIPPGNVSWTSVATGIIDFAVPIAYPLTINKCSQSLNLCFQKTQMHRVSLGYEYIGQFHKFEELALHLFSTIYTSFIFKHYRFFTSWP